MWGGGGGGGGGKLFYDLQACSESRLITDYPILVPEPTIILGCARDRYLIYLYYFMSYFTVS